MIIMPNIFKDMRADVRVRVRKPVVHVAIGHAVVSPVVSVPTEVNDTRTGTG